MRDFIGSEKGSILPMFAVVVTALIIVMAVAIDFSRYVLVSEKLKTASDSAAVAAAMSAKRYVRVEIDPGRYEDICCNSEGKCRRCCKDCGEPIEVEGREDELIEKRGYKKYCCSCGCGRVEILERWVEYENNGSAAKLMAETYFDLNRPKEMTGAGGESEISSIAVYNNRSSSLYPSVVVRTEGRFKTLMLNFLDKMYPGTNLSELNVSRCSQGGTYYYDLDGNWHRSARSAEGCE